MNNFNVELTIPTEVCPGSMKIRMAGRPDAPLFCLADLCEVLGNANPRQVAARVDPENKAVHIVDVNGQASSQMLFVTEPGLYAVVMTSRAENAKPFQRWVYHDVLPSIRRHGCYPPPTAPPPQPLWRAWSERISTSFMEHYAFINRHRPGWWSVLIASSTVWMALEDVLIRHCLPVTMSDRPDGSVGKHYARHRRGLGLPDPAFKAPLYLPDRGRNVDVNLFSPTERGLFEIWLLNTYIPEHCPHYLVAKYGRDFGKLPPLSAADHAARRLTGSPARLKPPDRRQLTAAGGFVTAGKLLAGPAEQALVEIPENN
jgi:hypothetical protein